MADSEVTLKLSMESSSLEKGLESARDGLQDLGAEAKGAGAEAGEGFEDLGDEIKVTGDKAGKAGDDVEDFGAEAKGAGDKADKAGDNLKGLGDDAKGAGDKAKDAGDKLKGLGDKSNSAGDKAKKGALSLQNVAKELGWMPTPAHAAAAAVGAVGSAIGICIKHAADFEVALDNVNTVLNLNERALRDYGQSMTDGVCYRSNCMAASCPGSMAITGLWLGDGEGSPGRSGADQRASVVPKASSLVACSRQGWSTSSLPSRAAAARQL